MSRSWPPERDGRERPRARRAQTEPLAAIAAVLAVCLGLSLYALAIPGDDGADRSVAEPTLQRASATLVDDGTLDPGDRAHALDAAPDGYRVRITVRAAGETWYAGPTPPESAQSASRPVGVRTAPGRVRPGRLTVEVWA